jgi:hypothetical protein|tara:strand:+ start:1617 stop:2159 length:543 start_codon:yes stop_codon:yes gene_type:complete
MGDSQHSMTETYTCPTTTSNDTHHKLKNNWVMWAHLPHDTDWTLKSYKKIALIEHVEGAIELLNALPDKVIKNCMLFIMKQGINPTWEDPVNAKGGCFSYKITNTNVSEVWKKLSYCLVGESLLTKNKNNITGITISPKKNFCIIKIWMSDCNNPNPTSINYFQGIDAKGCLFKKHNPEY